MDRFAKMADTYGFCEMETPILERTTLFKRALGSTSDIISSELYHVISTEPDGIVLRPEGTAPVLRAISRYRSTLGTGGTTYGTRIWYTGKMFRHERPQRLRYREFTQLGCEIIADSSITADVDTISLAHNYLKTTSIPQSNIVLHINTLGSIDDRKVYNDTLKKYLSVSPRYEALSELSQLRVDKGECMRILDSKLSEDIDIMKNAPTLEEFVGNKEKQRFAQVCQALEDEDIQYNINRKLVRGLDYYTSTAFEFEHENRAVAAGGRYSDLFNLSGVGFAIGLDRIEGERANSNSNNNGDKKVNIWNQLENGIVVVPIDSNNNNIAKKLTREMRMAGVRSLVRLDGGKLGKQISRAIKANARAIVMVGSDDVKNGNVKMKIIDKQRGDREYEQVDVRINEVAQFCQRLVSESGTS